ncbi:MAG: hypothetical protein KBC57_04575 [Neisseriaceae bacterium]|nr:hypothetical protein [Neisseriaceae bacterium]
MFFTAQRVIGLMWVTLLPVTAFAAQATEAPLRVYVSAYGFAAKIKGDVAIGPLKHSVDVPFSDTWDNLDSAYMAYLDVAKGRWGAYIDKQYVKTTNADQVGPAQLRLKTKLDRTSVGVYVTAFDTGTNDQGQRFSLAPTIGLHFTSVTAELKASAIGLSKQANRSASWREPYIGTRFLYDLNPHWNVAGQVDIGSRHSKGYQAYVGYRTELFKQPTNLRLGYRVIDQKHQQGNFNWDIKQSGPVLGLSMQLL